MSPTPPDPHVYQGRGKKIAIVVAIIVVIAGLAIVFANKPGAGMGGSVSAPSAQSQ